MSTDVRGAAPQDVAAQINALGARANWPIVWDAACAFVTPSLRSVQQLWFAKCGGRRFPARDDFSLSDLRSLAKYTAFIAAVGGDEGLRFKTRVMGSELERVFVPMTGRFIDEVMPPFFAAKWATMFLAALRGGAPVRAFGRLEYRERRHVISEIMFAPLAQDGETADGLMAVVQFHFLGEGELEDPESHAAQLLRELEAAARAG